MNLGNFHTHSNYCDGEGSLEDYVIQAIGKKFKTLGFSSHAPVPFQSSWNMKANSLRHYCSSVKELKNQYKNELEILLSLEIDYLPNLPSEHYETFNRLMLDYSIGSVHFAGLFKDSQPWAIDSYEDIFIKGLQEIYSDNVKQAVCTYYEWVRKMTRVLMPSIIGHLDIIKKNNINEKYFSESKTWYKRAISDTLDQIKRKNQIVEVNTRGLYGRSTPVLYPSEWILYECLRREIPIMVNSDAHSPDQIDGCFEEANNILRDIGIRKIIKWNNGKFEISGLLLKSSTR